MLELEVTLDTDEPEEEVDNEEEEELVPVLTPEVDEALEPVEVDDDPRRLNPTKPAAMTIIATTTTIAIVAVLLIACLIFLLENMGNLIQKTGAS